MRLEIVAFDLVDVVKWESPFRRYSKHGLLSAAGLTMSNWGNADHSYESPLVAKFHLDSVKMREIVNLDQSAYAITCKYLT
jgi:hypothetical protein